jgi:hypothetical protein
VQADRPAEQPGKLTRTPSFRADNPEAYEDLGTNPLRALLRTASMRLGTRERSPVSSGANPSNEAVHQAPRWQQGKHVVYQIPEGDHEGDPQPGASGWMCPLTAPAEMLPQEARLEGNVLDMGANPNMHVCRLGRTKRFAGGGNPESCSRESAAAHSGAGTGQAPVFIPDAAKTESLKQRGYIDWLGQSFAATAGIGRAGTQQDPTPRKPEA